MAEPGEAPIDLSVDHRPEPINVVPSTPRFTWRVETDEGGGSQTAYRIQVARTRTALDRSRPDCWDSARVETDQSAEVVYDGVPLTGDEVYYWRVRFWDDAGNRSPWSEPSSFGTALTDEAEWAGEWIGYQPEPGDAHGFRTRWLPDNTDTEPWVQVDLGRQRDIATVSLHPASVFERLESPDGGLVTPLHSASDGSEGNDPERVEGFGFPDRYRIEVADDPGFSDPTVVAERSAGSELRWGTSTQSVDVETSGRYVRVVATDCYRFDPARSNLRPELIREDHSPWRVFALAGLSVCDSSETDLAVDQPAEASSSVESETWDIDHLTNGIDKSVQACSAPRFRTEIELDGRVERARVHFVGLGYGELFVNGEKIGDGVLDPAWTDYDERVLYETSDVTEQLSEGSNALGLWLGRGRFSKGTLGWAGFGSPRARLHLTVEYVDGRTRTVGTDGNWTAARSPIEANDIYDGESYDARRAEDGWAEPGFSGDWRVATPVSGPDGDLHPQQIPSMEIVTTVEPVDVRDHEDGPIVDFGQNLTGWIALTVRDATAGDEVTLRHAETLSEDGDLSTVDLRGAAATDTYVARGEAVETYEPRFTYHGFRYAQIRNYPGTVSAEDITAKVVTTAMDRSGTFDCSDQDVRQIQQNAVWGLRGNTHSIPEDCPQRDERFGWTGDAHITSRALQYNFDAARFQEKWLRDHDDVQSRHGYLSDTIPRGFGGVPGDPTWTITRVVVPWHHYQRYGDEQVLADNYEGMRRYVDYWHSLTEDGILPGELARYGDWLAFENTDGRSGLPYELFTTAYHYRVTDLLARAADVLGQTADSERYRERAGTVVAAFNDQYLGEDGVYGPGTQSAYAVPLFFDMVPNNRIEAVVSNLVEKVRNDGTRLMTGFLGTRPLLFVLVDHGHADLAYEIVTQPERPSWTYMVRNGATTMWERWDSDDQIGSGMNSLNHSPFTFISEWFYEALAGIRFDRTSDASVIIAPATVTALDWVEATVETQHGEIASRWERTETGLELEVTVPWNTTATVRVPNASNDAIRVDDTLVWESGVETLPDGITDASLSGDEVEFVVQTGTYRFTI